MHDSEREQPLPVMCLYALAIGLIAGLGAWLFRLLIGLFHNLFFLGTLSVEYDANVHTPASPWGPGIILAPVAGGLVVVWLVKSFAPEAKGHGVPEVVDAIHYQQGRIRPVVAVVKSLASAICIGSGGSVGREGPIIQIGSAFGSTLGQIARIPTRQRITLIAAGAGGGIAATFNAPLGGLVFAIELLLVSVNARNLVPVGIATVVACYTGRATIGTNPAFDFAPLQVTQPVLTSPWTLLLCVPFGVLIGLVCFLFVRGLYWAEDRFDELPVNDYVRHASAMSVLGLTIYLLFRFTGHYSVQGVGYATIMDVIRGNITSPAFLALLFVLKLVATCLTLGSGGSGGVFSPALYLGATMGALFGHFTQMLLPNLEVSPVLFVIAGMAAAIGGSTGAIVTGAVMLLEMTDDVNVTIPIILTSTVAYGVRKRLSPESIYTLKLIRRNHVVPEGLQTALTEARRVSDVMETGYRVISPEDPCSQFDGLTIVADGTSIMGVIEPMGDGQHNSQPSRERCRGDFVIVPQTEPFLAALRQMHGAGARALVAVSTAGRSSPDDVVGVVTDRALAEYQKSLAALL